MKLSAVEPFTVLDYPDRVACIAFTPGCNMRCGFCHNSEFVLPERIRELQGSFIAAETFYAFLEARRGLLDGVVVSGGEPTIWNDLPDFLRDIKERGFLVKLDTNGNHPEMLERVLRGGLVDYVAMDVKTSLDAYPTLVGPLVRREHIRESIRLLCSSGIDHEFRSTLIKEHHTPSVLQGMRRLLRGTERLYLQTFRPKDTLNPVFARYHSFTPEEMAQLCQFFGKSVAQVAIRS